MIKYRANILNDSSREDLVLKFRKSGSGIIFLDYDGTLVPFVEDPLKAVPDKELIGLLGLLKGSPGTDVVLISGRDKDTLSEWFGPLDLTLVAEHGAWIKKEKGEWHPIKPLTDDWKPEIFPLLRRYTDRVPGSFIEEKSFSLVWHYRKSDQELASVRAKELVSDLLHHTSDTDLQVLQGSKVIEIKNSGINKGGPVVYFLSKRSHDFIMAIGDDLTDEDMFRALPEDAFSIKVGIDEPSHARFCLKDHKEVRRLIKEVAGIRT